MSAMDIKQQPTLDNERSARARPLGFGPSELTENEVAWVEFVRLISNGRYLEPTLYRVQLLREICKK